MRLAIELSGEHPTLPRAEVYAAMAAEGVEVRAATFNARLLRLEVSGPAGRAVGRLGLAHLASEEVAAGDFETVRSFAREADLEGRRFRVRAEGIGVDIDVRSLEGALGADFARTGKVDLDRPEVEYRLLVGDEFVLGRVVHRMNRSRLEARKVAKRSFTLPISLHPKLARALVNLARVPRTGTLLDPFCGTGGIVLEAADIGIGALGTDRARRMIVGTRRSMRALDLSAALAVADAGLLPMRRGTIQGIATDPPYGRAASTRGEPIGRLYARAFDSFAAVLPAGGHAAVVLPSPKAIEIASARMELIERHELRVHRSLVRHFCVFVTA
ncbi:MAG TPA: TRM11 family methyltransferase [Thermoplasmata archaeon]